MHHILYKFNSSDFSATKFYKYFYITSMFEHPIFKSFWKSKHMCFISINQIRLLRCNNILKIKFINIELHSTFRDIH